MATQTIHSLVTLQETAMAQTALCADCWGDVGNRRNAVQLALSESDYRFPVDDHWDFGDWHDCSGNEALECQHCGATA